ncbi:hypothetical protein PHMEG_00014165 [Phytophthora megakarya]|uniref:Uncharacterized protein n=1 Tax=Phytophthora megakarya TaxID=4795 RepID=A0A225W657_9STRA|nr:hypothetical protein PHMEG_00014165 [Phytophthora megakarya]
MQAGRSTLITGHGYSVKDLVEHVRDQTDSDYRSNKALYSRRLARLLRGYKFFRPGGRHISNDNQAHLRISKLPEMRSSTVSDKNRMLPLGAVRKKDTNPSLEVHLIHDLSFPRGLSGNDVSDKAYFLITEYLHVTPIVRRIEVLANLFPGTTIYILNRDDKSAFRHLTMASEYVS